MKNNFQPGPFVLQSMQPCNLQISKRIGTMIHLNCFQESVHEITGLL
jgi:hypothetical protein